MRKVRPAVRAARTLWPVAALVCASAVIFTWASFALLLLLWTFHMALPPALTILLHVASLLAALFAGVTLLLEKVAR